MAILTLLILLAACLPGVLLPRAMQRPVNGERKRNAPTARKLTDDDMWDASQW